MALKWGICSTGKICNDFCSCLKSMSAQDHQIVAVVSRSKDSAEKFASKFEIPKTYDSYEKFANDPEIDVVYIGSVCTEHVRLTVIMLKGGKHVLCEKPFSISTEEVKMVNKLAKEKNLFFMEGLWVRCFPTYKKIREELKSGTIGDPQMVSVRFCTHVNFHDLAANEKYPSESGGFLLEAGIYTVQFALMVYEEMPVSITAVGEVIENGYDVDDCIILTFSKGQKACLMCSSKCCHERNTAIINGTKGSIEVASPFYCPEEVVLPSGIFRNELPPGFCPFIWINASGLRYEAEEVRRCIKNGLLECPDFTHKESEIVHTIIDQAAKQIGRNIPHTPTKVEL
ncbi:trans-1,2-dihydrobenzene-1,2-diol dehydrogenase-like isoform X2 [Mytilus californianus]|uniref:trans-1,2-dihydrobenzene-1,2-diol dehydrogenase-like isoform X1 n=3 Tax=Mytilus californianus TaxID=6549 RepID=UPI002247EDC1|nr:trans-1,2-dihydrobenzene-1,2-diol dehydrogenase-like isoform X1 [Mytilus californianus]XP_052096738.1 trans-1,2-dihydrobenzene-1,2-diol dehydrogenase-like isoform X2 [Mytilus californianus]